MKKKDNQHLREHNLRIEKKYRPKYRQGLIAIRFLDDEKFNNGDVDDNGNIYIDYQNIFSTNNYETLKFIKYFQDKYNIKKSEYRSGTDDYYIYFKCKIGQEEEKIKEISKDKIVKVVDFVDIRSLEVGEELINIGEELIELGIDLSENSEEEIRLIISDSIKKLNKI